MGPALVVVVEDEMSTYQLLRILMSASVGRIITGERVRYEKDAAPLLDGETLVVMVRRNEVDETPRIFVEYKCRKLMS